MCGFSYFSFVEFNYPLFFSFQLCCVGLNSNWDLCCGKFVILLFHMLLFYFNYVSLFWSIVFSERINHCIIPSFCMTLIMYDSCLSSHVLCFRCVLCICTMCVCALDSRCEKWSQYDKAPSSSSWLACFCVICNLALLQDDRWCNKSCVNQGRSGRICFERRRVNKRKIVQLKTMPFPFPRIPRKMIKALSQTNILGTSTLVWSFLYAFYLVWFLPILRC